RPRRSGHVAVPGTRWYSRWPPIGSRRDLVCKGLWNVSTNPLRPLTIGGGFFAARDVGIDASKGSRPAVAAGAHLRGEVQRLQSLLRFNACAAHGIESLYHHVRRARTFTRFRSE